MATAAPAAVPNLDAIRQSLKDASTVWPTYMLAITSLTMGIAILGNGWLFIRGVTKASLRDSAFHVILINQFLCTLLHSGIVFPGFTNQLRVGMGDTAFVRYASTTGIVLHLWFLTTTLCLQTLLAMNRALSAFPHWKISQVVCSKVSTVGAAVAIWVICFIVILAIALDVTESFQGAYNCMVVDDYIENMLAGKELRPLQPAMRMVKDAVTSFIAIDILVNALSYVAVIWGAEKLGANQGDLSRTAMIMALMLAEYMAFWVPHIVAFFYNQDLLKANYAYMYLPTMGMAVAPVLYMVTHAEYRPPCFVGGDNVVTIMPSKSVP